VDATDELGKVMHQRAPRPPAPDPDKGGLTDMGLVYRRWAEGLDHVSALPADLIPTWVVDRAPRFHERLVELSHEPTDRLVHWDIRDDNLLERPDGSLVFVDWGAAGVGADWLDPLIARLERVDQPWFDASLATSPALVRAGDDAVTTWLVGIGGFLAWRAHTAVDINLPTLNDFRRRESARFLAGAARRLGI
jgi:aminoglycoside phosphotransferase (APT) family kinase protein